MELNTQVLTRRLMEFLFEHDKYSVPVPPVCTARWGRTHWFYWTKKCGRWHMNNIWK